MSYLIFMELWLVNLFMVLWWYKDSSTSKFEDKNVFEKIEDQVFNVKT